MNDSVKQYRKNRPGAGRKVGTGNYGSPTEVIRIPSSHKAVIIDYLETVKLKKNQLKLDELPHILIPSDQPSKLKLNVYTSKIAAGLPQPADDHSDDFMDINSFLVQEKGDTFIAPVASDSLKDLGIVRNHYVVINKALRPKQGDIVAAIVDNGFTIKVLSSTPDGRPLLKKANPDPEYQDIEIKEGMDFDIWGVVTGTFARL
ncbi:MAG: S24 family peptidase [Methylophilaceae bacterium]